MKEKLTATTIRTATIPAGKTEAIIFDKDIPGFGLRLREGGSRKFIFQYKLGTKQRRMMLGVATPDRLADARKTADKLYSGVTHYGHDPAGNKAEAKAGAAKTFKAVADDYLAYQKKRLRERSYPDVERHLLKHAKALHELQLAKIDRADIAAVLTSVTKNSGDVTANRVRTSLSGFYAWAMEEGAVGASPVIGTRRHEEKSRERVLTPAELRLIWNSLADDHFSDIIRLLALTAQREAEIAGLRWSEVDGNAIKLPRERTKNGRPHSVPLSAAAAAVIAKQPRREGRDLIFGIGDGPFSGWSNSKAKLDARIKDATGKTLPPWRIHDLRRSAATMMAEIGIQPHIIEAVLNHISGHRAGVAGIYNRATYEPEKRTALDRWAEHLLAVVKGQQSNVTPPRAS
jgi:integrase